MAEHTNEDLLSKVLNRQDVTPEGLAVLKAPHQEGSVLLPKAFNFSMNTDKTLSEYYQELDDEDLAEIIFPESHTSDIARFLTVVPDSIVVFDTEAFGFSFLAIKKDIEAYIQKYQVPNNSARNATTRICAGPVPELYEVLERVQDDIQLFLSKASTHEKINFLYLLCSGNITCDKTFPNQSGFDITVRQFLLNQLSVISNQDKEEQQEEMVRTFAHRFPLAPELWNNSLRQLRKTIGEIKLSTPISMDVVLSDGSRANLFELDKSKTYKIMHNINVSKLKQPYNFSNLSINGNFICENVKAQIVFPVEIKGAFYCPHYKFPITRIPDGTTIAELTHTVKSFADLNKIEIPSSLDCIMLTRSLILKAVTELAELEEIAIFTHNHPDITICDNQNRVTLLNALEEQQKKSRQKQIEKKQTVVEKRPVIAEKTDDWIPRKQIVEMLSTDERFNDVADLPKLIQRATNINTSITEQKLLDGIPVLCVHKNNVPVVINAALDLMNKDKMRVKKQDDKPQDLTDTETAGKNKKDKNKKKTKKVKTTDDKIIHVEKPKPIDIEKYIPKNVWKDICDSCKDSSQLLYSVLEKINLINMDYTKQQKSGTVQYIDDNGQMQVISTISKKGGCALGQSINPSDRKRIVWTMNPAEKIMVATAFLETHAETIKAVVPYKTARTLAAKGQTVDGTFVTRDLIIKNNYLKVSDLLEQYKPEKTEEENPVVEPEPAKEIDIDVQDNPIVQENKPVQPAPVSPVITQDKKSADTIVKPIKYEQTENKHVEEPKNQTDVQPKTQSFQSKRYELVDLQSAQIIVDDTIRKINEEIIRLAIDLYHQQNNPREQLHTLEIIKTLIRKKMRYMGK